MGGAQEVVDANRALEEENQGVTKLGEVEEEVVARLARGGRG